MNTDKDIEAEADETEPEATPADDIRADIAAAIKSTAEAEPLGGTRDPASGKFIATPGETKAAAEPVSSLEGAAPVSPGPFKAPDHWSAEDKAWLAKFGPDLQPAVVDRFKKIEDGFQPKLQRAAAMERDYAEVDRMFEPHAAAMQAAGLTKNSVIRAWANVEQRLMNGEGAAVLREVARNYKIDLSKLVEGNGTGENVSRETSGTTWVDPEIAALRADITGLKQSVTQREAAESAAKNERTLADIRAFAEAKDAAGALEHPLFTEVMPTITRLAAAARQSGEPVPPLKELYEQAVWANPSTRAKQLAAANEAEKQRAAAAGKVKSEAARKAGSSVAGSPSPGATAPTKEYKTVREAIEAAVEEHRA